MRIGIAQKSKWPIKTVALVGDNNNLQMHLKELVRSFGWRSDDPPALADLALAYLENGTSFLFIVEDTTTTSAYESVRALISHPAGRLTPILALLNSTSAQDTNIFERVMHVGVARKPLTPNQFTPAFKECVHLWETPVYVAIRKCAYSLLNGEIDQTIPALKQLNAVPQVVPYCTTALAQIYAMREEWREAEAVVLEAIKAHPRLPSLMLTVANFYTQGRMPAQALRFYTKLRGICNNSAIFSFDIAQSALAMGQIDLAIEALTEWNKARPGSEMVVQFLARLYMAEGREVQLEKLLNMNKASVKKIQEIWEKSENPTATPISA